LRKTCHHCAFSRILGTLLDILTEEKAKSREISSKAIFSPCTLVSKEFIPFLDLLNKKDNKF
jgi:hypothetical protein